jgi:hypothetical protein
VAVDGSGPARLDQIDYHGPAELVIANTGVVPCFVGGSDVTDGSGMTVDAGATLQLSLRFGDDLFAVCGPTESTTVEVFEAKW